MKTAIRKPHAPARAPAATDHEGEPARGSSSVSGAEGLGHTLSVLSSSASAPVQLERNRRRWTPQQREASRRFWEKKHAREERRNRPRLDSRSHHPIDDDGYSQSWTHPRTGDHVYKISSGHGYRAQHREGGPDITQLASRHEIESAIVHHLSSHIQQDTVKLGQSGENQVQVGDQAVHYRYKRFAAGQTGIGTYFLP
ncbi:hypothetical protein WMF04_23975 [Sorangium sp. So ce260]|uniref:hypothetical protein n=1 Tax=Sorangium sp. So ce260 TaxID=3133291 RepID=UPI003F644EC0